MQGLLASWGCNESGQLGLGSVNERPQHNPKLLRGSAAFSSPGKSSGAGASQSPPATRRTAGGSGGSNSSSPVAGGHGSGSTRMAFVRCAVGACNSLALSSSGRCFTFGQVTCKAASPPVLVCLGRRIKCNASGTCSVAHRSVLASCSR
jgi:hypothetical protein